MASHRIRTAGLGPGLRLADVHGEYEQQYARTTPRWAPYGPPLAAGRRPPARWPYGPGRPGVATAAVALGSVTAGLTSLVTLVFLLVASTGDSQEGPGDTLLLGFPCAVGMALGAARLLSGRSHRLLFYSALAADLVLPLAVLVAVVTQQPRGQVLSTAVFMLFACPLPTLTAIFAVLPRVEGWAAAGRP